MLNPRRTNNLRRVIAGLTVAALAAAACGGDDDADRSPADDVFESTEDDSREIDTSTTAGSQVADSSVPDTSSPKANAPDWATDPTAVRDRGLDDIDVEPFTLRGVEGEGPDTTNESGDEQWVLDGPCAYQKGLVAVFEEVGTETGIDGELREELELSGGRFSIEDDGAANSYGFQIYETSADADPLGVSVELLGRGVFASPVYLASPMPARMFFPGTLPVPGSPRVDTEAEQATASLETTQIVIVDTGDQAASSEPITKPWTYGHGKFIESVTEKTLGGELPFSDDGRVHVKIDPGQLGRESTSGLVDEFDLATALMAVIDYPVSVIVNMSFGVYPCYVNDRPILPVIATAAFARHAVGGQQSFIIAAAGNSADERITVPAAFADLRLWANPLQSSTGEPTSSWSALQKPPPDSSEESHFQAWQIFAIDELPLLSSRMIAVGATPASWPPAADDEGRPLDPESTQAQSAPVVSTTKEIPYSTSASWVTTIAEGCHVAEHPGASILYPDETNPVALGPHSYWCGSSFAAPVVAAQLAQMLEGQSTDVQVAFTDFKSGLPTPPTTSVP